MSLFAPSRSPSQTLAIGSSPASSKIEINKEAADVNKETLDGGAATEKNQGDALANMASDVVNNVLGIALEDGFVKPGTEKK